MQRTSRDLSHAGCSDNTGKCAPFPATSHLGYPSQETPAINHSEKEGYVLDLPAHMLGYSKHASVPAAGPQHVQVFAPLKGIPQHGNTNHRVLLVDDTLRNRVAITRS